MYCMFVLLWFHISFIFSQQAYALPEATPLYDRTIAVEGQAHIRVHPDRALLVFSIRSTATDLKEAQYKNDNRVSSITQMWTKDLALDPKHIQTGFFQAHPVFVNCFSKKTTSKCDSTEVESYVVHKNIVLELQDLSKYKDVINKLFELKISSIDRITFYSSKHKEYREQAQEIATLAAKEKAERIAKTLNVKVGPPLTIYVREPYLTIDSYNPETDTNTLLQLSSTFDDPSELVEFAPSQLSIKAHVDITFILKE